MQGIKRRVVYVTFYELIAIAITTTGLALLSGHSMEHASVAAVASSIIAVIWNFIFNNRFEAWERRQVVKGRSIKRRVAHAIGFEGGLVVMLVPLFAWWLEITLLEALIYDAGLIVFFLVYTFVFNWGFDSLFGLPASAQAAAG